MVGLNADHRAHNYAPMETANRFRLIPPTLPLLRKTRTLLAVSTVIGAVSLLLILAFGAAGSRGGSTLGYSLVFLLGGVLGLIYLWVWPASTRLLVGVNEVGYQNMLGQRRLLAAGEIAKVVDVTILYRSGKNPTSQRSLLLIGLDGRCLFNLRAAAWTPDAIQAFIAGTGRPSEVRIAPLTAREARREFPGSLGWIVAHPGWGVWIMIAIAIAAIVLFLVYSRR
jgi:hypothetical protein